MACMYENAIIKIVVIFNQHILIKMNEINLYLVPFKDLNNSSKTMQNLHKQGVTYCSIVT